MQQCTNCKCQVGSGISVCPYCGAQLPIEEPQTAGTEATYIRPSGTVTNGGTYRVTYLPGTAPGAMPVGNAISTELPMRYETSIYYSYPEREKRERPTETILLALLICMIVANVFNL